MSYKVMSDDIWVMSDEWAFFSPKQPPSHFLVQYHRFPRFNLTHCHPVQTKPKMFSGHPGNRIECQSQHNYLSIEKTVGAL